MALISAFGSFETVSSKQCVSGRSAVPLRSVSHQVQPAMSTAASAAPFCSSRYAILELGGVRQMVEEGHDYTCLSRFVQEARTNGSSNSAVFHSVLGVRSDGQFTYGKPFVPDAAVEVEVLEEFQGPVPKTAVEIPVDNIMARYRVKHITASSIQSS